MLLLVTDETASGAQLLKNIGPGGLALFGRVDLVAGFAGHGFRSCQRR